MANNESVIAEAPKQFAESANTYLEKLAESHERMTAGIAAMRERNQRIADKLVEATVAAQRDAIALSRTIVASPTDYSKNMEAVMDTMSTAQDRTLDVAKTVYREQAEYGSEFRGMFERAFEAGKGFTKPFEKMNEMWSQAAK